MVVVSDVAKAGDKELKTNYPIVEGLTLGTTKLKDDRVLEPQEEDLCLDHWGGI